MGKNLVILTGAGISAESGLKTFRDNDGLWENHRVEDVATPEAFARDPHLVHRFYNLRRAQLREVQPNAAHVALVELEENWDGDFLLVSQNVDDLHRRAGSKNLLAMHGQLNRALCLACERGQEWAGELGVDSVCPVCGAPGALRPDIVWFGEMPYFMEEIQTALARADLFVSIGTSGRVFPAAAFVTWTKARRRLEVNNRDTEISSAFDEHWLGPASVKVPELVRLLLKEQEAV